MTAPLNVFTVLNRYQPGGAERVAFDVLEGLDRERFRQRLVLLETGEVDPEKLDPTIERVSLGKDRRSHALALPWRLASLLRAGRCDVVIAHLPFASIVSALSRLPGRRRYGLIAVHHSMGSEYEPGSLREWFYRLMGRWAYSRADAVVAVHRGVEEHLRQFYGSALPNIVTIANGIDEHRIARLADERLPSGALPPEGRFTFVAAGRLSPEKGHAGLVEAFIALRERVPDVVLLILGDGPERRTLERLAAPAGDSVRFLGHLDNPYPYMRRADALVLPSLWEGLPVVLLEAMSLGLPVVGTDLPAVEEVIRASGAGSVVPVGDASALASAMESIVLDGEVRRRFAEAAASFVSGYGLHEMLARYAELIDRVARTRGVVPAGASAAEGGGEPA